MFSGIIQVCHLKNKRWPWWCKFNRNKLAVQRVLPNENVSYYNTIAYSCLSKVKINVFVPTWSVAKNLHGSLKLLTGLVIAFLLEEKTAEIDFCVWVIWWTLLYQALYDNIDKVKVKYSIMYIYTHERSAHLSLSSDWATFTPIVILLWGDRHTSSTASLLLSQHWRMPVPIYSPG